MSLSNEVVYITRDHLLPANIHVRSARNARSPYSLSNVSMSETVYASIRVSARSSCATGKNTVPATTARCAIAIGTVSRIASAGSSSKLKHDRTVKEQCF